VLDAHGISWVNYRAEVSDLALWPRNLVRWHSQLREIGDFGEDCRAGRLSAVSLITPEVFTDDGEFEDDQLGEAAMTSLFESASAIPSWPRMMFIIGACLAGFDVVPTAKSGRLELSELLGREHTCHTIGSSLSSNCGRGPRE
jgi:hypothetical protein